MKNKTTAAILALVGGTIGLQQAYLGNDGAFGWSILFCWTGIPAIISFFHAIYLICLTQQSFDKKYNGGKCSDVCLLLHQLLEQKAKTTASTPSSNYAEDLPEF
ncbi:MAG: hypothetical protein K2M36_03445 [Clostridia bacterium]|nr:hypothetical protein [Clostridia bacterium]